MRSTADLGLANGGGMAQISPTFGVFASGQLAHAEHDGFTVTTQLVGTGPSFDADDFSAAISVDFNAAKHFGFDQKYGLNLGLFAGYASTDVGLGSFQGFDAIGDATNNSGMFGGYGLFRQGYNYALVSAIAFLGETDVTNGVLNSTGSYDTEGYGVTGSVGHIFTLDRPHPFRPAWRPAGRHLRRWRLYRQRRQPVRMSQISFGAVKFEPGIYADYQLRERHGVQPLCEGRPAAALRLQNTAIIDTREIDFDDADFSAALSTGFNLKMSQSATVSGEIRGKLSSDSSTFGGKLGVKVPF